MDKIYCGNGKEKTFSGGGSIISVTLDLDQLITEYNNHGYVNNQNKRMIRIDVGTRRTVGQYGETHSVTVNTWHPDSFNKPAPIQVIDGIKKAAPDIGEEEDPVF